MSDLASIIKQKEAVEAETAKTKAHREAVEKEIATTKAEHEKVLKDLAETKKEKASAEASLEAARKQKEEAEKEARVAEEIRKKLERTLFFHSAFHWLCGLREIRLDSQTSASLNPKQEARNAMQFFSVNSGVAFGFCGPWFCEFIPIFALTSTRIPPQRRKG